MKQELKHTELRCGNLVYNPYLNEIRTVDYLDIRDHAEKILYTPFEGIELTPEWLQRLGLEDTTPEWYTDKCFRIKTETGTTFDYWLSEQRLYINEENFLSCVYHVHHLQNIIHALTGRELELKK